MANGIERTPGGMLFRTRWLPVLAYVALIFTLSAQPGLTLPGAFKYRDKLAHLLEYGGLSGFVFRAARDTWPGSSGWRRALIAAAAVSALGACDEAFQSTVPMRDSSAFDWLADTLGGSLAQALGLTLARRRGVA